MIKIVNDILQINKQFLSAKLAANELIDQIDDIYTGQLYEDDIRNKTEEQIYFFIQEFYDAIHQCIRSSKLTGDRVDIEVDKEKLFRVVETYTGEFEQYLQTVKQHT